MKTESTQTTYKTQNTKYNINITVQVYQCIRELGPLLHLEKKMWKKKSRSSFFVFFRLLNFSSDDLISSHLTDFLDSDKIESIDNSRSMP